MSIQAFRAYSKAYNFISALSIIYSLSSSSTSISSSLITYIALLNATSLYYVSPKSLLPISATSFPIYSSNIPFPSTNSPAASLTTFNALPTAKARSSNKLCVAALNIIVYITLVSSFVNIINF